MHQSGSGSHAEQITFVNTVSCRKSLHPFHLKLTIQILLRRGTHSLTRDASLQI